MTQHVRKAYRKHPKWAWVLAVAAITTLMLAVVLPAGAGLDGDGQIASSPVGVVPTLADGAGGNSFSCTASRDNQGRVIGAGGVPSGMLPFKISAPPKNAGRSVTYTQQNTAGTNWPLPKGVEITVTAPPAGSPTPAGRYFSFSIKGGSVFHVGVNGGNDTAWYNYYTSNGVTADGKLHATSDNQGNLYNLSWTTFCFLPGNITATCNTILESQDEAATANSTAKFAASDACTRKVEGQRFIFTSYVEGTTRVIELGPAVPQGTSPSCQPDGTDCLVVAQKAWWQITALDQSTLKYDDPPYNATDVRPLKFCIKDPFDRDVSDGHTLNGGVNYEPRDILPAGETTCLARSTQGFGLDSEEHPGLWRLVEVYSAVDGRLSYGG